MPLKRLKPEMRRLPKPQQYFLCPSPMLSLAHLLHFLSADQLSCLSSPEDIYAECVHSSQVYMLPSPPGGRFTLSTSLSLSLSVSPPPPQHPHSTPTHPNQSPNSWGRDSDWLSSSPSLVQSTIGWRAGSYCTHGASKSPSLEFGRVMSGRRYKEGSEAKNGILFRSHPYPHPLTPARSYPHDKDYRASRLLGK